MLRATPLTKGGLVESLQIWNNGHPDQIGHFWLPLFFGFIDDVQYLNDRNLSMETSNLLTDMVPMLASKMLHTPLFTAMVWSSLEIQLAKVVHLASKIPEGKTLLFSLTVA